MPPLSDYVTAHTPPDDCHICRFKADLEAEDAAWQHEQERFFERHHILMQSLKRWAKTPPQTAAKTRVLAQLAKGEREWPMPKPRSDRSSNNLWEK